MLFTAEQEKVVLRVLGHPPHKYYEILEVSKTTTDGDIKKSYRKLAIKCHPDKNQHPRSAEAFKVVNKAWEVLSDPSKKRIYDQTGADPDLRASQFGGGGGGPSPFAGAGRGGGGAFSEDDLFNMFFGGGGAQTFSFGNGGFQFHNGAPFGQQRPRAQPQPTAANARTLPADTIKSLFPLIMVLFMGLMAMIFNEGDSAPAYSFLKLPKYRYQRTMPASKEFYYVPEKIAKRSDNELANFDRKVEMEFYHNLFEKCLQERRIKKEHLDDAQGWYKLDGRKLKRAQGMKTPNCERLFSYGLL